MCRLVLCIGFFIQSSWIPYKVDRDWIIDYRFINSTTVEMKFSPMPEKKDQVLEFLRLHEVDRYSKYKFSILRYEINKDKTKIRLIFAGDTDGKNYLYKYTYQVEWTDYKSLSTIALPGTVCINKCGKL